MSYQKKMLRIGVKVPDFASRPVRAADPAGCRVAADVDRALYLEATRLLASCSSSHQQRKASRDLSQGDFCLSR